MTPHLNRGWIRLASLFIFAIAASGLTGCSSRQASVPSVPPSAAPPANSSARALPQGLVKETLVRACYDCHSDERSVAWNAKLAPSYWARESARDALDFSQWQSYGTERKVEELKAITKAVNSGKMPPGDYTLVRPSAKLSPDQRELVAQWASEGAAMPAH